MRSFSVYLSRENRTVEFTSEMDDAVAVEVCAGHPGCSGSFPRDLAAKAADAEMRRLAGQRYTPLSWKQWAWIHYLANQAVRSAVKKVEPKKSFLHIAEMMARLGAAKKSPRVHVLGLVFSVAGERARVPGSINVASEGKYGESTWYGRLDATTGEFAPNTRVSDDLLGEAVEVMASVDADPSGALKKHGLTTCRCAICNLELSTADSLHNGYGRVCASNLGLPYERV